MRTVCLLAAGVFCNLAAGGFWRGIAMLAALMLLEISDDLRKGTR